MHLLSNIRNHLFFIPLFGFAGSLISGAELVEVEGLDGTLSLSEIQVVGSHNSYHLAPPPGVLGLIRKFRPDGAGAWNYSHPDLTAQLDLGIRQFELDVFLDPDGGKFADPWVPRLARGLGQQVPAPASAEILKLPGTKILHVPDIDCWTNAPTLAVALKKMRDWSDEHPNHLPVMILLECKDQKQPPLPTVPEKFTRERLLEMEQEILAAMPLEKILTPDDVRGERETLREAVIETGWPDISELAGKFLFMLDNEDAVRMEYMKGNPSLEKRLIFVSAASPDDAAAAWFKVNDASRGFDRIRSLVDAGFLVRTRADTGKIDPALRDRAFTSGAQWISSDHFPLGDVTAVEVAFPDRKLVRKRPER